MPALIGSKIILARTNVLHHLDLNEKTQLQYLMYEKFSFGKIIPTRCTLIPYWGRMQTLKILPQILLMYANFPMKFPFSED